MALYGDPGAGRHGPYWRRQQGITHPGELTLQQLNQINGMRQRMGLPPLNSALSDSQLFPGGGRGPVDPRTTPGPPLSGLQLQPMPGHRGQVIPLPRPAPIAPRQIGPLGLRPRQIRAILPHLIAGLTPPRRQPYASPLRAAPRQRSFAL